MESDKEYVAGLGEILFDCLPDGKKLGGAPANFAYHASQLGLNGIVVSAVGDDGDGHDVARQLSGCACHLETVPYPTGTVKVRLSDGGIPQYDICQDVAYDNIPWTSEIQDIARNCKAVCFGTLSQRSPVSRSTILRFLDSMPKDSLKVFDINLRQNWFSREVIEDSLRRSDILKINDEEIIMVAGMLGLSPVRDTAGQAIGSLLSPGEFLSACQELLERYRLQMIVLTCGAYGSYVITQENVLYQDTPHVSVADTVGAGDSFTAAFISSLLQGKSVQEAHSRAVSISAFVCTQQGAMPAYPADIQFKP